MNASRIEPDSLQLEARPWGWFAFPLLGGGVRPLRPLRPLLPSMGGSFQHRQGQALRLLPSFICCPWMTPLPPTRSPPIVLHPCDRSHPPPSPLSLTSLTQPPLLAVPSHRSCPPLPYSVEVPSLGAATLEDSQPGVVPPRMVSMCPALHLRWRWRPLVVCPLCGGPLEVVARLPAKMLSHVSPALLTQSAAEHVGKSMAGECQDLPQCPTTRLYSSIRYKFFNEKTILP